MAKKRGQSLPRQTKRTNSIAKKANCPQVSRTVLAPASDLLPDFFFSQKRISLDDFFDSNETQATRDLFQVVHAAFKNSLLFRSLQGERDGTLAPDLLNKLRSGGVVHVSVSRHQDSDFCLEVEIESTESGYIEVNASPSLAFLRSEWELAFASLDTASADFEQAKSTLKSTFAERLAAELPVGVLLPMPESGVLQDQKKAIAWIEVELAHRRKPLADSGIYSTSTTRRPTSEFDETLVTYIPRTVPSVLEEWIDWVQTHVPRAFRRPLKSTIARPGLKAVEIGLDAILDSNRFSELEQHGAGAEDRLRDAISQSGTEALGWFQPYHDYDKDCWGIYLHASRLLDLGLALRSRLSSVGCPSPNAAFEIANRLVLEHELFHARLETFALAHELSGRRPAYLLYTKKVYMRTVGTPGHLEEALADYVAHEFVRDMLASWASRPGWISRYSDIVMQFIEELSDASPAGYRDWRLGARPDTWRLLASQTLSAQVAPPGPCAPLELLLKTLPKDVARLDNIPIWITTDGGIADRLFGTPSRREVIRFLERNGFVPGSGGKHPVYHGPKGTKFPLPTRDPLSKVVFRSLLQSIGITKKEYMMLRQSM